MNNLNGILLVNKPKDFTSRDVVNKVSHILGTKKIGHTGTLDPIATGVLILTIGKCTKLSDMLTDKYKEYEAEFVLGFETDTLDITGVKVKESKKLIDPKNIRNVIKSFQKEYWQEVPKYSAVKIDGKKLYEYARNGIDIELPKRLVDIKTIEVLSIKEKNIKIKTTVSKGTYIRSLIRDIGDILGTYATMISLVRTKQGNFSIEKCFYMEDIEKNNYEILKPINFLSDIKTIEMDEKLLKKVDNGVRLKLNESCEYIKFVKNNEVIALYKRKENEYCMYIKLL